MKVGVLALQGSFAEHLEALKRLKVKAVEVRKAGELKGLSGLIIPGGESTTLSLLIHKNGLAKEIKKAVRKGMAVYGTCAGCVLLSKKAEGRKVRVLGLMDFSAERNGFGRQRESFVKPVKIWGEKKMCGVFIRAPRIRFVGPKARVLVRLEGEPVMVEQGKMLASSFHPELAGSLALHRLFLEKCR